MYYFYKTTLSSFNKKNLNIMKGEEYVHVYWNCLEEDEEETVMNKSLHLPINYYFITEDLSLNMKFKLKWIRYYIRAIRGVVDILNDEELLFENLTFENNIDCDKTLQKIFSLKNLKHEKHTIELFIENELIIVDSEFDIDFLIENLNNINNTSESFIYSTSSTIDIKLKLNLLEFIILTSSNCSLGFYKEYKENILIE